MLTPDCQKDSCPSILKDEDSKGGRHVSCKLPEQNFEHVPTKRQRTVSNINPAAVVTASEIVRDVFHAITEEERMLATSAAATCFEHELSQVHDEEIDARADIALCKNLALLLMKHHFSQDPDQQSKTTLILWKEIAMTCSTIEMVYRCSDSKLAECFNRTGEELLPLLLTVMANCLQRSNEDQNTANITSGDKLDPWSTSMKASNKIIARFATIPTVLIPMAQQRGLLSTLKRVATSKVIDEARFSALWTLANLAYDADNMVMIACHPGLVDALVEIAYADVSFEARNHAAKAISNLAWRPENKIPLSERPHLLDAMVGLIGSSVTKTRRHAARALRFLSDTPSQEKVRLCQHGGSIILSTILKRANNDADRSVRECAATAISNLVCEETAELMGNFPGLMQTLSRIAIMTERGNAPTLAGEALCSLAELITKDMQCYQELHSSVNTVLSCNEDELPVHNVSSRRQNMLHRLGQLQREKLGAYV